MKQIQRVDVPPAEMARRYATIADDPGNRSDTAQALRRGRLDVETPLLLSTTTAHGLIELLLMGKPVHAIKKMRKETGADLAAAKSLIDQIQATIRHQRPLYTSEPIKLDDRSASPDPITEFTEALKQARGLAGQPSLQDLAQRLEYQRQTPTSKTSLHRVFSGATVPPWDVVNALLIVFGVELDVIEDHWRTKWMRAHAHRRGFVVPEQEAPRPGEQEPEPENNRGPQRPDGHECEACGAWVVNLERHQAWHWRVENGARSSQVVPLLKVSGG